ncbi:hypothetical protein Q7P37_001747 [Cladosporium fusiforme]
MQIKSILFALLTVGATLPTTSAATWNKKLQVYDVGRVPSQPGFPGLAKEIVGKCGGIPEGGGLLRRHEVCGKPDRCVRNGRRAGKKFYPLVPSDKIVCVKKEKAKAA